MPPPRDLPQASPAVEDRLQLLTDTAESLSVDDPFNFSSFSSAITTLSENYLSAQRRLNHLKHIEFELETHLSTTNFEQRLVDKWDRVLEEQEKEEENAITIERRKEDLARKAKEYHKELKALLKTMPEAPRITVTRLKEQEKKNKIKLQELQAKRLKIKAFNGLPPNLELARYELRQAQQELEKLTHLRERLLGRMAESVS